jgi:hypothetical protein
MSILDELAQLGRALSGGVYPEFVSGGELGSRIPVFLYHVLNPAQMEAHFAHLRDNEYETLSASEHLDAIGGSRSPSERRVVLTFDDGLTDLYEVAFPLLERYQLKAVAFVIPARVGRAGMASWDQLREMHRSERVDVQSHSMHHVAIPISPTIKGFFNPDYRFHRLWELPVDAAWTGGIRESAPPFGTPIFECHSRLGDARRYLPDPAFERACVEHVQRAGGSGFFKQPRWQRALSKLRSDLASASAVEERYETVEQQREAITAELAESKARIEREMPGASVAHLAYPWSQPGDLTRAILRECGYLSAYSGLPERKKDEPADEDRYELPRLNGDFVLCLPGKGRRSLLRIFGYKAFRRITEGEPY